MRRKLAKLARFRDRRERFQGPNGKRRTNGQPRCRVNESKRSTPNS